MTDYLAFAAEALLLTLAVELAVAWLLGLRSRTQLLSIVLINVVTNPLLNYLLLVNGYFHLVVQTRALTVCLEAGVVLAEWALLVWALRLKTTKMLALSVVMNASSYFAGLLILARLPR